MATTLSLFPARIRFVNDDGTLTPEAYRALQTLVDRSGGILGDNGVDTFGDLTGAGSQDSSITDMVAQQTSTTALPEMLQQPVSVDSFIPDIVQPESVLPAVASGGAAPAGGVGTAAGGWDTAGHRDSAITLLNTIRTALIARGILS